MRVCPGGLQAGLLFGQYLTSRRAKYVHKEPRAEAPQKNTQVCNSGRTAALQSDVGPGPHGQALHRAPAVRLPHVDAMSRRNETS